MKILVLSDNHHRSLKKIHFSTYDVVVHCGDCGAETTVLEQNNVQRVAGNCDKTGQKHLIFTYEDRKIFVTHGDLENVKYSKDQLIYKAMEYGVDVCFYGHTHQQEVFIEENILFLNPGAYPDAYAEIQNEKIILFQKKQKKEIVFKW